VDGGSRGAFDATVDHGDGHDGCAFFISAHRQCGVERRPGSSYCAAHHALCHIAEGSLGESRQFRATEALAKAVGGKNGSRARRPPEQFLRWLENLTRVFLRPKRSCIVRGDN
jgi:hypothetical protein